MYMMVVVVVVVIFAGIGELFYILNFYFRNKSLVQ